MKTNDIVACTCLCAVFLIGCGKSDREKAMSILEQNGMPQKEIAEVMQDFDSLEKEKRNQVMKLLSVVDKSGELKAYVNWKKEEDNRVTCICNLKQIQSAMEMMRMVGKPISWMTMCGPQGYIKTMPVCPSGGEYEINPLADDEPPTCTVEGHSLP